MFIFFIKFFFCAVYVYEYMEMVLLNGIIQIDISKTFISIIAQWWKTLNIVLFSLHYCSFFRSRVRMPQEVIVLFFAPSIVKLPKKHFCGTRTNSLSYQPTDIVRDNQVHRLIVTVIFLENIVLLYKSRLLNIIDK